MVTADEWPVVVVTVVIMSAGVADVPPVTVVDPAAVVAVVADEWLVVITSAGVADVPPDVPPVTVVDPAAVVAVVAAASSGATQQVTG